MRRMWGTVPTIVGVLTLSAVSCGGSGKPLRTPPQAPVQMLQMSDQVEVQELANADLERYQKQVQEALAPALLPIATAFVRSQRGADTSVNLDWILVGPEGRIGVRLETHRGMAFTQYILTFKWQNGWQLIGAESDA